MICKCPNCGDVITYNVEDKALTCKGCGNTFSAGSVVNEDLWKELETMECDIYKCSTCGAEISTNDVEVSTFCGYCGQPTIVFNRMVSQTKPQKIIPFSITKDEAEKKIRRYLKRSIFTKRSIRNFKTERIVGIYVPFWLFDMNYSSKQTLKGDEGSGKNKRTYNYYRECECNFKNLTVDASMRLDNTLSSRLEPYDFADSKAFDIGYLSGFYADCYDVRSDEARRDAISKAKHLYDSEVIKTVPARNVSIMFDQPDYQINSSTYAMLPAWFLSFIDKDNKCYTILVNGQTGKVVGALPYIKAKVTATILTLGTLFSIPCICFMNNITYEISSIVLFVVMIRMLFVYGLDKFDKLKTSIGLTTAKTINKFAEERQDK